MSKRATRHATDRLQEHFGLELRREQWEDIVANARSKVYEVSKIKSVQIHHVCVLVPMGNPDDFVYFVPMVVNLKHGVVITVLPAGTA